MTRKVRESEPGASTVLRRVRVPPFEALGTLARGTAADDATRAGAARILDAVRADGDRALERFQREFDRVSLAPGEWEVPRARWEAALVRIPSALREALERAARRIREYHEHLLTPDPGPLTPRDNLSLLPSPISRSGQGAGERSTPDETFVAERIIPLERVGVYIPGGKAAYPHRRDGAEGRSEG